MSPYRAPQPCEPELDEPAPVELDFDPAVEGAMWIVPVDAPCEAVSAVGRPLLAFAFGAGAVVTRIVVLVQPAR